MTKKNLVIFCGARFPDVSPEELASLKQQISWMCQRLAVRYNLVYGGGHVGLMGFVADEFLQYGGHVTGVIPDYLNTIEIQHLGLQRTEVVEDLHQRKSLMENLGDAFLALPGGLGTLDELCEVLTLQTLDRHQKTVYIWNWKNTFDGFFEFIRFGIERKLISADVLKSTRIEIQIEQLLKNML